MNGRLDDAKADDDHAISGECAFTDEHAAGFALGALDRFERGLMEQHLRWCARCREIVQAAENVTAFLPYLSPPVPPPSGSVRAALMERIAADSDGPILEVPPVPSRFARSATVVSLPATDEDVAPTPRRRWAHLLPAALVAPLAIALILVSAWANSLQNTIDEQDDELATQRANALTTSGDGVQMYPMKPHCTDCTGGSTLGVDMDDNVGMLVAWNLDPKKEHSVWCVDSKGDKAWISTLDVDPRGGAMQTFTFPGKASNYSEVYIAGDNGSVAFMTNIATPPDGGEAGDPATPSTPVSDPSR